MDRVKGKTCIVTGAALGIGRACAERLAEEGGAVALFDLHDAEGEAVAAAIRDRGGRARYWHVDVSDEAAVKKAVDEAAAEFGGLRIVTGGVAVAFQPEAEQGRLFGIVFQQSDQILACRHASLPLCWLRGRANAPCIPGPYRIGTRL